MCASMNKWWDWEHVVGPGPCGNIGEEKGADECAERRIRSRRKVEQEKKDECEKVAVTGEGGLRVFIAPIVPLLWWTIVHSFTFVLFKYLLHRL